MSDAVFDINTVDFPDTRYAALTKERMKAFFGARVELLPVPSPFPLADLMPVLVAPSVGGAPATFAPPDWDKLRSVARVSQDDPMWARARVAPGVITASAGDGFLHARSPHAKAALKIPDFMVWASGANPPWSDFAMRLRAPTLPSRPLDSLAGATYTTNGKEHENNANAHFLLAHPDMHYRDQGMTYVTPDVLAAAGLRHSITREPITSLPFLLAASPDGVVRDADGTEALVEWKAANPFRTRYGARYPGISMDLNTGAKPYDEIKSYYVPQAMIQLLACGKDMAYWGCWTLMNGMQIWTIHKSVEYLELMLTILIHLHETFAVPNRPLPWDYFAECRATPIGVCHGKLVTLTSQIIQMRRPDIARKYHRYSGDETRRTAAAVLLDNPALDVTSRFRPTMRRFPDIPPETPAYARVALCVDALGGARATWLTAPFDTAARTANLTLLIERNEPLHFLAGLIQSILDGAEHQGVPAMLRRHPNVVMWRLDKAERFASLAALALYRERVADRPLEIDEGAAIAFMRSVADTDQPDRAFGLAIGAVLEAISAIENPSFQLVFGREYYLLQQSQAQARI